MAPPTTQSVSQSVSSSKLSSGWFTESSILWPGQRFSLSLDSLSKSSVLHQSSTNYQDVLIFRSSHYGTVLCLDGVIQVTERDEFSYSEAMANIPLNTCCCETSPSVGLDILIIGGGDGCVLREVLKHKNVRKVTVVEIDEDIIKLCKDHLGKLHLNSFSDPRCTIINTDAYSYLLSLTSTPHKSPPPTYDCVINDTSDPCGPSESLYSPAFFKAMYDSLKPGGVVCSQCESPWLNSGFASDMTAAMGSIYDVVEYGVIQIPSYPTGCIGVLVGGRKTVKGKVWDLKEPRRMGVEKGLRYYGRRVHGAVFDGVPKGVKEDIMRKMRGRGESWDEGDEEEEEEDEEEREDGQEGCSVS